MWSSHLISTENRKICHIQNNHLIIFRGTFLGTFLIWEWKWNKLEMVCWYKGNSNAIHRDNAFVETHYLTLLIEGKNVPQIKGSHSTSFVDFFMIKLCNDISHKKCLLHSLGSNINWTCIQDTCPSIFHSMETNVNFDEKCTCCCDMSYVSTQI